MSDVKLKLYIDEGIALLSENTSSGESAEAQENPETQDDAETQSDVETQTNTGIQSDAGEASSSMPFDTGSLLWFACGLAVPIVILCIWTVIKKIIRKPRDKETSPAPQSELHIEKLHELGARKNQQDCFAVSPLELAKEQGLLMIVADGMGGLSDGDKISQAAVSAALNAFFSVEGDPRQILLSLLAHANRAVSRLSGSDHVPSGGTTFLMGLFKDNMFHYLSVGDSRISLYRNGQLYQLNREHIYCNELALSAVNGEIGIGDVYSHRKSGGLTSFLGMGALKHIDLPAQPLATLPGDKIILMSDGVYNALTAEEFTAALDAGTGKAADALNQAIQAKGYARQDNYTAIILSC